MARDEVNKLCYDWMIEFVVEDMWNKFKNAERIEQDLFVLAKGLIEVQKHRSSSKDVRCREVVFLMLTSSLMSLRESMSSGEEESPEPAEFRHFLRMTTDLSAFCRMSGDEKSVEAVRKTILQIIVGCLRQGKDKEAETVFEEYADQLDKETTRAVRSILHTKNKQHRFLKDYTMEDYLSTMTDYLETVHDNFHKVPFMMKRAEYFLTKGQEYKGVRSRYFSQEIGGAGGDEDMDVDGQEERAIQKTLKAMRKRTMKQAFLSVQRESGNDIADEVEAADGTPDSTVSPRKKDARVERDGHPSELKTRSRSADSEHTAPSRQHTERRSCGKPGPSVERGAHRSEQRDQASVSDGSSAEEVVYSEESEDEEDTEKSLQSRIPVKIKPFSIRRSLSKPPTRGAKVKPRRLWTEREEEEFYLAVQRFGVGNWQTVRLHLKSGRSNVQLKDKWRTIMGGHYQTFSEKYGPVELD